MIQGLRVFVLSSLAAASVVISLPLAAQQGELIPPDDIMDVTLTHGIDFQVELSKFRYSTSPAPELTYSLTGRPAGIEFSPSRRIIFNNTLLPHPSLGTYPVTYTATAGTVSASVNFNINVVPDSTPQAPAVEDLTLVFVPSQEVNMVLPAFARGIGELSYTLTDDMGLVTSLVGGLMYDQDTRIICCTVTGTPRDDSVQTTTYDYKATDMADTPFTRPAKVTIKITDDMPSFVRGTIPSSQEYRLFQDIGVLRFPLATGGTTSLTYTFEPELPAGFTITPTPQGPELSGFPTGTSGDDDSDKTYKFVVTDADGDRAVADGDFRLRIIDEFPNFGTARIPNIGLEPNVPLRARTLPRVPGSSVQIDGEITYSFSPALPSGLRFNATTRVLDGTPTTAVPLTTYNYIATDRDGDTDTIEFTIEVRDSVPVAPTQPQTFTYEPGKIVNQISGTLRPFTEGNGTLTYTLADTPALPDGLRFSANPVGIRGTVRGTSGDDDSGPTTYTYTATDSDAEDADSASATFTITIVDDMPAFADNAMIAAISAVEDAAITPVTLPAVMTGTGDGLITYSITGLPNGLSLNTNNRMLSGTPAHDAATEATTYTYTATDVDGDKATLTFTITVEDDLTPNAPVLPVSSFNFTPGQVVSETLPIFTSGNGKLTYSIRNSADEIETDLVAELSFDPQTRIISGTIPATPGDDSVPTTSYTYAATDSDPQDPDTESVSFTITVTDFVIEPVTVHNFKLKPKEEVNRVLPLFTTSNGDPLIHKLTSAVTPDMEVTDLVADLEFDPETNTISGTAPGTSGDDKVETTTYRWSATNPDPDDPETKFVDFTITVVDKMPDLSLSNLPTIPPIRVSQGGTLPFPRAVGGDMPLTYTFKPDLPNGLMFDPDHPVSPRITGRVLGSPDNDDSDVTYKYTATDADGDKTERDFRLAIIDYLPSFGDKTINDITITPNTAFYSSSAFPDVIPGEIDGVITYSLTGPEYDPALPQGLMFDSTTRMLTGTPTAGLAETTYTYTATDRDGDTATITFNITVESDTLTAPTLANAALTFTPGQVVDITLRDFNGGNRSLTYSLTPAFPVNLGLSFIPETRTIEGTVTGSSGDEAMPATPYTYKAIDQDGEMASTTFTITIVDDKPKFRSDTLPPISTIVDTAITTVTLPEVTRAGTGTTTYTLTGPNNTPRPAWLDFDDETFILSGTPQDDDDIGSTILTFTATDEDGDADTLTFTIAVAADDDPTAPDIEPFVFEPGQTVSEVLDVFEDGNGSLTYAIMNTADLPLGLSFNSETRKISGVIAADTPGDDKFDTTTFTYTATDTENTMDIADDDEVSTTFTITVVDTRPVAPTVNPKEFTFGVPLSEVTLPPFTISTKGEYPDLNGPKLTLSLSPQIPWLTFNSDTRMLTGEPNLGGTTTTVIYTATDGADTASTNFNIAVEFAPVPPIIEGGGYEFTPRQNLTLNPVTLPDFTSGDGTLTYSLTDGTNPVTSLVGGLTFTLANRTITGTVGDDAAGPTEYTYTAEDEDGDSATVKFTIEIQDSMPTPPAQQDLVFKAGLPLSGVFLDPFTGGDDPVTYALSTSTSNALSWLTLDPSTRELTGDVPATPNDDEAGPTEYTYMATDLDGDVGEVATFTIAIEDDIPEFADDYSIANIDGIVGTAIQTMTLQPVETDGTSTTNYSLTLADGTPRPEWIEFIETTRVLSGTPGEGDTGQFNLAYTATDIDGDTDDLTFTITVVALDELIPPTISDGGYTFNVGDDLTGGNAEVLPAFSTPSDPTGSTLTHSLTNEAGMMIDNGTISLIGDLMYDQSTRTLSGEVAGNPENAPQDTATYNYSATNADGESDSVSFTITIIDEMPDFTSESIANINAIVDSPINAVQLPAATGTGSVIYEITPALPTGLSFNDNDMRMLSGTPDPLPDPASQTFTYTATDEDEDTANLMFTIAVAADDEPAAPVLTDSTLVFTPGQVLTPITLPTTTGGNAPLTYSLTNGTGPIDNDTNPLIVNSGLLYNQGSRVISGTVTTDTPVDDSIPANNNPVPTFTYIATDNDNTPGYERDDDTAETTFTIQIVDPRPTIPMTAVENQTFITSIENSYQLTPFTTNVDNNPDVPRPELSYTLTGPDSTGPDSTGPSDPDLPQGLSFGMDPNDTDTFLRLYGTPTETTVTAITLTYTATEVGGMDTASVTFTLSITDDTSPVAPTIRDGGYTFTEGEEFTEEAPFTLPKSTNDDGSFTYSLSIGSNDNVVDLIGNLMFNPSDRTITGTADPETANADDNMQSETYTYTATDTTGESATVPVTITVTDVRPSFGDRSITDISTIANSSITPATPATSEITLPEVLSDADMNPIGTGDITYALTPTLPNGLVFNANTDSPQPPMLSGRPDTDFTTTTFTYTATDDEGDFAELTFTITVAEDLMPAALSVQNFVYVVRQSAQRVTAFLPGTTGGNGELTYSLTDGTNPVTSLVGDLSYNPMNRIIMGEIPADTTGDESDPTDVNAPAMFTYTATDEDGDPAPTDFIIQIIDPRPMVPNFGPDGLIVELTLGINNDSMPLPEFDNNIPNNIPTGHSITPPTFTYTLTGLNGIALPDDLTLDPTTRVLSGTPNTEGDIMATYTATEVGGMDSESVDITIRVTNDPKPMAPTFENGGYTFTVGEDVVPVTLPEFIYSGPREQLSYQLNNAAGDPIDNSPNAALIGGLMYNQITRTISGPLGTDGGSETYTYIATDNQGTPNDESDYEEARVMFTITVIDEMPTFGTVTPPANIMGTQGEAITTVPLPAVMTHGTGGSGSTTYSLTDPDGNAPTNGLMFVPSTRTLSGTPNMGLPTTTYTYMATDEDDDSVTAFSFTITIEATELTPPAPQAFTFIVGEQGTETLDEFTGGTGEKTYALNPNPALPDGLEMAEDFATSRVISGTIANTDGDDSVIATTFTYTATDEDGTPASTTFTITVQDNNFEAPAVDDLELIVGVEYAGVVLDPFRNATSTTRYELVLGTLESQMDFDPDSRRLTATPTTPTTATNGPITVTYRATTPASAGTPDETAFTTFTITITGVPSLNAATASALPTVSANIALVASQAISSRIELALDGLTQGVDIRALDGTQFRLNPSVQSNQQNGGSSGSSVRFGVWYSAASDTLTDTRSDLTWNGTTDSTNIGFDVGFDISESGSLVVGILQNSSSTSATYSDTRTGSNNSGTLSIDLDSTAFYVGLGFDWLDAWFANGSADSTLNDSQIEGGIPASFSYQTIGLTAAFEVADSFNIGGKLESLTSDLSLAEMSDMNYNGLQTDSSQLRTALVANYQLQVGQAGNGLLIPKFEFGFRDLTLNSSIQGPTTAAGGSAMETGFGIDYFQRAWGLTLGFDIRSISVENYSSDSTQWQVRWESGSYGSGLSFNISPHSVSETLGGIDSLYSGGYNQYQSVLERQRGGSTTQDSKGMDFEVGYGIASGYGTVTPYLKTSNFKGIGNRTQELGIRYQTLQGLELTVKAERERTPQTTQLLDIPATYSQQENTLTLTTRYSF